MSIPPPALPHVRARLRPAADPADAPQVAAALLRQLGVEGLQFRSPPRPVPDGWEAWTYALELEPHPALPDLTGPLALRVYASPPAVIRARREFAVQQHLRQLGFPVAQPLRLETSCAVFGGPFLLLHWVPGRTLFDDMLSRPWRVFSGPRQMGRLHARLHSLPGADAPLADGPFLPRRIEELRSLIGEHDLVGLRPGLDWLSLHRPPPFRPASILHLDWHPLNLIRGAGGLTVLDWAEADVGDPHADLATALLMIECFPHPANGLWGRAAVPVGRWLTRWGYLAGYRRERPVDERRLAYYRAWAALRRLALYGRWLCAGPASTGSKPSAAHRLRPAHLRDLCRYFERYTGTRVRLCRRSGFPA
jgi:aminoglycoside phosphotransferase (APT) family kinase protein